MSYETQKILAKLSTEFNRIAQTFPHDDKTQAILHGLQIAQNIVNELAMPEGANAAECKYCGKEIVWIKTAKGKNLAIDPERVEASNRSASTKETDLLVDSAGAVKQRKYRKHGLYFIAHFHNCEGYETR